ncbi:eukaryotic membrane protein family domain-containing protein [Ditylenchus destructor]|nr:eukaryotic membrane protein family domain-containing protein [Ditylenchus destructor]
MVNDPTCQSTSAEKEEEYLNGSLTFSEQNIVTGNIAGTSADMVLRRRRTHGSNSDTGPTTSTSISSTFEFTPTAQTIPGPSALDDLGSELEDSKPETPLHRPVVRQRRRPPALNTQQPSLSSKDETRTGMETPKKKNSVQLNESLNIVLGSSENTMSTADAETEKSALLLKRCYSGGNESNKAAENPQKAWNIRQDSRNDEMLKKLGMFEFVWMELTRGYSLQKDQDRYTEKRRKVYAFLRIPLELERFFFFGVLQCLDAFCHVFTFLPIRIIMNLFGTVFRLKDWSSADTCDILKILIILASSFCMQLEFIDNYVSPSILYHQVRGQSVIKLYIFYNMLEVADKLFSSFGQDILDALMWTASEKGGKRKFASTIVHLAFTILYAMLHASLVLLQATTLNVAFNSHNQSLLTIMMSNNFVELKGSVFKKFAKPNLFQMSCSDVRERFHTVILLIVVVLRNMTAVNWKIEHLIEMLPDLAMVIIAELLVDWLKHCFITKFNEISAEVYQDFTITLAFDVVRSHEKHAFSDFSDQVSRRMGFIPIPISIMLIRVISQSIDFHTNIYVVVFLMIWFLLLAIKILTGVFLHGKAVDQVLHYRKLQAQAEYEHYKRRMLKQKSKSAPGSPRLSLIDFTDVLTQATEKGPSKAFTASDMLAHWEEMTAEGGHDNTITSTLNSPNVDGTPASLPRRCQSMVDFSAARQKRDKSLPPSIPETEERTHSTDAEPAEASHKENTPARAQASPKRRNAPTECENLYTDVQAYTMLQASEPVQDIQP